MGFVSGKWQWQVERGSVNANEENVRCKWQDESQKQK
jgi:hypothetical protein